MSFRGVQKLKDQPARLPGDDPPPQDERVCSDESLIRRLQSAKKDASGPVAAVLKDVEMALQARTSQIAALRRNYENLHTICEEYHEKLEALKGHVVGKAKVAEEAEAIRRQAASATSAEARARGLEAQLREAESQIASAKDQLSAQTTALQESVKATKRLAAALRVAEGRAAQAAQAVESAATAREAERRAVARLGEAEAFVARLRSDAEAATAALAEQRQAAAAAAAAAAEQAAAQAETTAANRLAGVQSEADARIASLSECKFKLEQALRSREADTEQLHAKQAIVSEALAADHARMEQTLQRSRQAEREAQLARADAEARLAAAEEGVQRTVAEAEAHEAAAVAGARAECEGAGAVAAQAEARRQRAEMELADLRGLHAGQAERIIESERARAALQARVRELEAEAVVRPAAVIPSLSEMQMQALHGELEGWRIVANQAHEANTRLEADLAVARRELKALGHTSAAAPPEPRAQEGLSRPRDGPRSRSASRGFLLPRGAAAGAPG